MVYIYFRQSFDAVSKVAIGVLLSRIRTVRYNKLILVDGGYNQ